MQLRPRILSLVFYNCFTMKNSILVLVFIGLLSGHLNSQIAITSNQPIADYVNNHLIGQGVVVSNITFTGNAAQIGSFDGSSAGFGFVDGTVISSGGVTNLEPSAFGVDNFSTASNADLVTVAQSVTTNPSAGSINEANDVAILEFDFIPDANTVSFSFVFGSNEYTAWINSQYNDAFGFFVSGPGITGPFSSPAGFPNGSVNLALVPNSTLPITISTIYPPNTGNGLAAGLNPQYYVDNSALTNIQLNGYTVPIDITFDVQCGQTYHFKFAVADMMDQSLSTAVFLEKGSFNSLPLNLELANLQGTDQIVEACTQARFMMTRSFCQSSSAISINYTTSGTATEGADYTIVQPSPLIFPAGEDTIYVDFNTIADALIEGTESITLNIDYIDPAGNPQTGSATFYLNDIIPLGINEVDQNIFCFNDEIVLEANGVGGSGIYTYDWQSSNSTTNQDTVSINQNGTYNYLVTITEACLGSYTDTVTVVMNQTLNIDILDSVPSAACLPTGVVFGTVIGQTGQPQYHWEGPGLNGPFQIDASVLQNIPAGTYYFSVQDNVCSDFDSIVVTQNPAPIAGFDVSAVTGCTPLTIQITNTSQNANQFLWNFGNGNNLNSTESNLVTSQTYTDFSTITLIASDGTCSDTTSLDISISVCGCTNPIALNYNPLATIDDGSCIFPNPTVEAPNVFTPNGDDVNDLFYLNTTNAVSVMLRITNRWGQIIFEETSVNPKWNGKINVENAAEGVYFYQYLILGVTGDSLEGHGFLELSR